jgi:hypothetical protein
LSWSLRAEHKFKVSELKMLARIFEITEETHKGRRLCSSADVKQNIKVVVYRCFRRKYRFVLCGSNI